MRRRGSDPLESTASPVRRAGILARVRLLGVSGVIAGLLALGGVFGTVLAARSLARTDAGESRQAFVQASSQIASTLRLAIARERDLVVSAEVFELENPHASNADFRRWAALAGAFARYPELESISTIAFVTRARLRAFEVHAKADRVGALGPHGSFVIIPPGVRPYYCFILWTQARAGSSRLPAGTDLCAGSAFIASRLSGRQYDSAIRIPQLSRTPLLGIQMPLYRGGGVPATLAGRRAAFIGWTTMTVLPQFLLDSALQGHPRIAVVLDDTSGSRMLAFTAGHRAAGSRPNMIDLKDGSTVTTYTVLASGGVLANANSRAVLLGGVLLSVLLSLLLLVLATARVRALRLVSEKTEELRFQAMHDPLTGLANRALVIDRAEQMLSRARRADKSIAIATMFIDVDGFKEVNDTLGHAAGDEFLRIIADRLSSVVRDTDTVGRIGGDEFVVLAEGEALSASPGLVAERILAELRQPFNLHWGLGAPQSRSVSIGVAVGQRDSPDDLLRDADMALYRAKEAGGNRYVIFEEGMRTAVADRVARETDLRDGLATEGSTAASATPRRTRSGPDRRSKPRA